MIYTEPDAIIEDFVARGIVILPPSELGIEPHHHDKIYEKEKEVFRAKQPVTPVSVPEILTVLRAPGLVGACNQLLGEDWAIVPFAHNAPFVSGAYDQHWHKDDNAPYNQRKHRHHHAVQIEMLYYPQAVKADMGPTAVIPYSHYWTFNHEENHDNFAGADHLDFNYQLEGMEQVAVSGPRSEYDAADIRAANTVHDQRMRSAVTDTGWPLVENFEAAPLEAGSVVLYSHNLFHRGNHRRDAFENWRENPRFMWRFFLFRTTEPKPVSVPAPDWSKHDADENITCIWGYQHAWLTGQQTQSADTQAKEDHLYLAGDSNEPKRIGAAYQLATNNRLSELTTALYSERENIRRAATYGLVAMGATATDVFLKAAVSPRRWLRKAGAFGLGEVGSISGNVLTTLRALLLEDPSTYVRSVAAGSIGCFARRAVSQGKGQEYLQRCTDALLESLAQENNRLSMDRAQQRSIKLTRPTDESDVCEGIGVPFNMDRFEPVRSAVRENALWALVIICSQPRDELSRDLDALTDILTDIMRDDKNVISTGYAMDALNRLHRGETLYSLIADEPLICFESLVRSGLDLQDLPESASEDPWF